VPVDPPAPPVPDEPPVPVDAPQVPGPGGVNVVLSRQVGAAPVSFVYFTSTVADVMLMLCTLIVRPPPGSVNV
jgi:hypothetical protein